MKKIIMVVNDHHVPLAALNFAASIAHQQQATIFGIFVHSLLYSNEETYSFPNDINLTDTVFSKETDEQEHLRFEATAIKIFSKACEAQNVPFRVDTVHTHFLDTLIDQSAFADILVCDADTPPTQYSLNTLLANAHCPVLLVNKDYKTTDTIVFTYDDKSSSFHAVKQFTYLFQWFKGLPVHFVSVLPHNILGIEYEDLIREWLPLHYPNADIKILKGDTKEELSNFINSLVNPLVIMGAFGRNSLSRFFKESLANIIMEKTNAPLFVTHD